jgi:hypothetical protein
MREAFAAIGIALALCMGLASLAHASARPPVRCMEDQPCWQWSTMGNLDRGVYVRTEDTGRPVRRIVVVDPCTFAWLSFHGRIDWRRTRHLRGDGFARRYGCNPRRYAPTAGR